MTATERLVGIPCPALDEAAESFLAGKRPAAGCLQALYQALWLGQTLASPPPADEAERRVQLCRRALLDPASILDWPMELREGASFAGDLARLIGVTQLGSWIDQAGPEHEREVERQLQRLAGQEPFLAESRWLPLEAWLLRERARLVGFQGGEPWTLLEQSLECAARLGQRREIQRCREFLSETGESFREERSMLAELPSMVGAASLDELRSRTLTCLLEAVPMEAALWLERREGEWEVRDWSPRHLHPRFSVTLVEECWRKRELTWGQPEQLRASRSILLSEVRSLLAVPVGETEVLFAWQSAPRAWLSAGEARVVQLVARLSAALVDNLERTRRAREEQEEAERLHQRWQRIFHGADGLALAELSQDGRLLSWNRAYAALFPTARAGMHASDVLPEVVREKDRQELGQLREHRSQLLYLAPRWYQCSDWVAAGGPGMCRALVDVSEREFELWFDVLEETRHLLAADLHDGPAQVAATQHLLDPGPASEALIQALRRTLDWFRSPWRDGQAPWDWLHNLAARNYPSLRLELRCPDSESARARCFYRVVLRVLEALPPETAELSCQLDPTGGRLRWMPATTLELPATVQTLLDLECTILSWSWTLQSGSLTLA